MSEGAALARNLARNCGYAVFPCLENKSPATPNGFKNASNDPGAVETLWKRYPGPLIGVAAGEASGVSIVDIDVKHKPARDWWIKNESNLPATRTFRTRGGGLHLLFQHTAGVRNSEGSPAKGVDTRGTGGYFIFWFATGLECLDNSPAAPWPNWLSTIFWPPPPAKVEKSRRRAVAPDDQYENIKQRAIDRVAAAGDGEKHNRLRSSAKLLGGIQERAGFTDADAIEWLAGELGLEGETKACDTVKWGLAKGRGLPLELAGA